MDYRDEGKAMLREQTAVEAAMETINSALDLARRIHSAVNQIVGQAPPNPSMATGNTLKEVSSGVLPELNEKAKMAAREIREAHEALSRLESAF